MADDKPSDKPGVKPILGTTKTPITPPYTQRAIDKASVSQTPPPFVPVKGGSVYTPPAEVAVQPNIIRDVRQVCENGHTTSFYYNHYPMMRKKFCAECGASTLTACPTCALNLPGLWYYPNGVIDPMAAATSSQWNKTLPPLPKFCENCGYRFPWTKTESPSPVASTQTLEAALRRFSDFAHQLSSRRHAGREPFPFDDEYDVQDSLHAVLKLQFDDVRPEESTPSYAGGASRLDFLLPKVRTVVETKFVRPSLTDNKLGQELIVDIARYKAHQQCQTLYCLVYDPKKLLGNPAGLEHDLSKEHDGLRVVVIVAT